MKTRLDDKLVELSLADSRAKAQALIMAGEVFVNGERIDKKAHPVKTTDEITVREKPPFVSRGGEKLAHALDNFAVDVKEHVAIDIGASTGGFTDCLLQRGASFVHALDVGHGQLAYSLRIDKRVKVYEGVNARHLDTMRFEPVPTIAVTDVSFISVLRIAPAVRASFPGLTAWIVLIKPQFEAERREVPRGGVIRDEALRERIVSRFADSIQKLGFTSQGIIPSPITGAKGNVEYLVHLTVR
ncbi:MAG: TlyA family RNA methyltransferase [Spirochaetota bacterium]